MSRNRCTPGRPSSTSSRLVAGHSYPHANCAEWFCLKLEERRNRSTSATPPAYGYFRRSFSFSGSPLRPSVSEFVVSHFPYISAKIRSEAQPQSGHPTISWVPRPTASDRMQWARITPGKTRTSTCHPPDLVRGEPSS